MMFDFDRVVGLDWDKGNQSKSLLKHSVTQEEAEQVFGDEFVVVFKDARHSDKEDRFHALGRAKNGRYLSVSFTMRANNAFVRVISARSMDARERGCYD